MRKNHTGLEIGDLVTSRGCCWRVAGRAAHEACEAVALVDAGRDTSGSRVLLHPFDRFRRVEPPTTPRVVGRRRARQLIGGLLAGAPPFGGLAAAAGAGLDLHAWQLEPALAVLRGRTRVLLADEVGLGKTVQAGLVLHELRARGEAGRVLILTPPGLREQWASELRDRFRIAAFLADAAALRRLAAALPRGVNPWSVHDTQIASIDFVKQPEVLRAAGGLPCWDLLIVDEAHMVAAAPERRRAVDELAQRALRLILLTATPHAGDARAFRALCDLGHRAGPGAAPVLLLRRRRADVGLPAVRRVRMLAVSPTAAERRMHEALRDYTGLVRRERGGRGPAALVLAVLGKRALSSARSLAISVERRLALLDHEAPKGPDDDAEAVQLGLPLSEERMPGETDPEDEVAGSLLAIPALRRAEVEHACLLRVLRAAREAAGAESKLAALRRLLARTAEPVIVFTEYRDTLETIAAVLDERERPVLLHGGLTRDERARAIVRFTKGAARALLATDAAGQGLNLQHRCRWIVNLELPWSPARLEQRIGRVDRLGQKRVVHAVNLVLGSTAEALVLAGLTRRLERIRRAMGSVAEVVGRLPESLVSEALLSGEDRPAFRALHDEPVATESARSSGPAPVDGVRGLRRRAEREVTRLETARRLAPPASGSPRHWRPAAFVLPRRRRPTGLSAGIVWICRTELTDGAGRPLQTLLTPVHQTVRVPRLRSCSAWLDFLHVQWLAAGPDILGAAKRSTVIRSRVVKRLRGRWSREPAERLRRILQDLARTGRPIQAPLFRTAPLRRAIEARTGTDAQRSVLQGRLEALEGPEVHGGAPALALAILVE